jgi:lysozyme family protein
MGETRVVELAREIVAREGGFVNDPDDPGGATKYGVTVHTMRRLGLDLDGDGDVDASDVKRISLDHAVEIFVQHYFTRPGLDGLPEELQPTVFDMYVNAGAQAVKILQRMLGQMGETVAVDGRLGPQTYGAVGRAFAQAPEAFVNAYGVARRNYYLRLADRRPSLRKFARRRNGGKGGWITRAESFLDARYHLSEAEFQARVSEWA